MSFCQIFFRFYTNIPRKQSHSLFTQTISSYELLLFFLFKIFAHIFLFFVVQVAWLRVDTQTILTIQNNTITKNHRIGITHTENRIWQLRIRDVKESDQGWYMVIFLKPIIQAVYLSLLFHYYANNFQVSAKMKLVSLSLSPVHLLTIFLVPNQHG